MQSFFKVFCWYYPVSIKYNFQLGIGDKNLNSILFKRIFNNQFEIENFNVVDNGYGLRKILILLPLWTNGPMQGSNWDERIWYWYFKTNNSLVISSKKECICVYGWFCGDEPEIQFTIFLEFLYDCYWTCHLLYRAV